MGAYPMSEKPASNELKKIERAIQTADCSAEVLRISHDVDDLKKLLTEIRDLLKEERRRG